MANDKDFKVKNGLQVGGGIIEASGTITSETLDLATGNVFSYTPAADTTFVFSNPPATGTAYGMTLKVTGADVAAGYDIANAVYDTVSFSVTTQETAPAGLFFKPDGAKMYVIGTGGVEVNEYSLSTAWDITSASATSLFSVSAKDGAPRDLWFKDDGTELYVVGTTSVSVHQYSLSTAWDVTSATFTQSFSVSTQETLPRGLTFKPDGTVMYVSGTTTDNIYQYSLSGAWDISTASYASKSYALGTTTPTSPRFSPDGTKLFSIDNSADDVRSHTLTTAWDVSTASYDSISFSVVAQETIAQGLFFKSDGSKMYVTGATNDTIYQYTTSTSAPATLTYPATVDWPSATAPTAPATGETDVYTFYTTDGGTTYYGFQVGDAMA